MKVCFDPSYYADYPIIGHRLCLVCDPYHCECGLVFDSRTHEDFVSWTVHVEQILRQEQVEQVNPL